MLTKTQKSLFKKLNTSSKIQDFLDGLNFNFENGGETYRSPIQVLEHGEAHCFEGALLALACFYFNNKKAYLLDIKTKDLKNDADHVVTIFQENGLWGAISKTNHGVLRYRDPIYKTVRELAMTYFHEYFLDDGSKTALSYSDKFDVMKKFGTDWIESKEDLDEIALALDKVKHYNFYHKSQSRLIRKASKLEVRSTSLTEYKNIRPKRKNNK